MTMRPFTGFLAQTPLTTLLSLPFLCSALSACGDAAPKDKQMEAEKPSEQEEDPDPGERLTEPLPKGEPITEASAEKWAWVDFPETRCMDDSATGLGIKLVEGSDKLLVVIQGGGACFNPATCLIAANANGFRKENLASQTKLGLLNEDDDTNPFRDWNKVFIPYCSGDIFSGAALDGTGYEGRTQAGYLNIRHYLTRLVPTFKDISRVVLNGYSAGGFAATVNWIQAMEAFGEDVRVDVLNDSGPPLAESYLTPCLQQRMAELWNWGPSIPKSCEGCDIAAGRVVEPVVRWSVGRTKTRRHGLISSSEDAVIKVFFGYGLDDCSAIDSLFASFPDGLYAQGLQELERETFGQHPGARSFIVDSENHVWTMTSPGSVESQGVLLSDWIEDFLDPDSDWQSVTPF